MRFAWKNNAPPDVGTSNGAHGWGEIRTRGTLSRTHAFQACALNHSATHPETRVSPRPRRSAQRPGHHACCTGGGTQGGLLLRTGRDSNSRYRVNGMPVFETGAFNHSATCPAEPRNLVRRKSMVNARNTHSRATSRSCHARATARPGIPRGTQPSSPDAAPSPAASCRSTGSCPRSTSTRAASWNWTSSRRSRLRPSTSRTPSRTRSRPATRGLPGGLRVLLRRAPTTTNSPPATSPWRPW